MIKGQIGGALKDMQMKRVLAEESLISAIKENNLDVLKELLDQGVNLKNIKLCTYQSSFNSK